DQALIARFESSKEGLLNFSASYSSSLKAFTANDGTELVLTGRAPKHVEPNYVSTDEPVIYDDNYGMSFEGRLSIKVNEGQISIENGLININDATVATLYFTAATSYSDFDQSP